MKPLTKILNARDKILFEKALKFYYFSRQQAIRKLNSELQERFQHSGRVAYSLIITYLREEKLRIEYMDFLNEEIKTLRGLNDTHLSALQIQPEEIDEIELQEQSRLRVHDEDENRDLTLTYYKKEGRAQLA